MDQAAPRLAAIAERFRDVGPFYIIRAVEVGKRPRNPQSPVKAPRRQMHGIGRLAQQAPGRVIKLANFVEHGRRNCGIGCATFKAQRRIALALATPRRCNARRDFRAAFDRRWQTQIGRPDMAASST